MKNTIKGRVETWEHAKECGLDGFISSVAKAFPGAIQDVCIESKDKISFVKDMPRTTVKIAVVTVSGSGLKEAIKASKSTNHLKGGKRK